MSKISKMLESFKNTRGSSGKVKGLVSVVVLFILIAQLAPSALVGLFNSTAFVGVPAWVPSTLGVLGVVGFIFLMLKGGDSD